MKKFITIKITKVEDIKKFLAITTDTIHDVYAVRGELSVDARSLLGVMSLDPSQEFKVVYDEEDESSILRLQELGGHINE